MAPSIVQHEIKSLNHRLVQLTPVDNLLAISTADLFQPKEPRKYFCLVLLAYGCGDHYLTLCSFGKG